MLRPDRNRCQVARMRSGGSRVLIREKISASLLAVAGLAFSGLAPAAQSAESYQVSIADGRLSGTHSSVEGVRLFAGIPFAAPPVGPLRWKEPQPVKPWNDVKQATEFAPSCVQKVLTNVGSFTPEFFPTAPFSEDCLYLNVWTGAQRASEKRPVMVWIHGGGYIQGGANLPMYYGDALAKKGVVFVSLNYRVGIFATFAHPELTAESAHHSSGSYGAFDQRAALQWVQKNIAAFGGDPSNVTLFGQSAGAGSVVTHMTTPLSRGLFKRAMAESGVTAGPGAMMTLAEAEIKGQAFGASIGAPTLAALRAIPAETLQAAAVDKFRGSSTVIDNYLIVEQSRDALNRGHLADVPLLTGFNGEEGAGELDVKVDPAVYEARVRKQYGEKADAFLALYPAKDATASSQSSGHDKTMVGSLQWILARTKTAKSPTYFYDFTHVLPGPASAKWGAFHSSEVPYVFNTLSAVNRPMTAQDAKIADQMSSYWVNFARTGSPNGPGLAPWPAFNPATPEVMELGDRSGPRPLTSQARLTFLLQNPVAPTPPGR